MTPKQIKAKSLKHYDKMIAWAEKQNPRGKAYYYIMSDDIGENWEAEFCSYCDNYLCGECPLNVSFNIGCCNNLWTKLDDAKTWKTWIKYAKQVRQYIEEKG